jgi:Na+/H+ antiporter NhaC
MLSLLFGLIAVATAVPSVLTPIISLGSNKKTVLSGIAFDLSVEMTYPIAFSSAASTGATPKVIRLQVSHGEKMLTTESFSLADDDGVLRTGATMYGLVIESTGYTDITVLASLDNEAGNMTGATKSFEFELWTTAPGVALLPPLTVLVVGVATGEVLWALFLGIWVGATVLANGNIGAGLLTTLNGYIINSLGNVDHAFILLFSWFLAGMVAVVQKSGGAHGFAEVVKKKITSRKACMLAIYGLGFAIFFDDYANTLILGPTMRPLADEFFVSREKLSFIVDATTAPIASIAPISSWIGYELSLIADELASLEASGVDLVAGGISNPYQIFLESLASRYYPIFMLAFQLILLVMNRDFGPMLKAERRAFHEHLVSSPTANISETELSNDLEPDADTPRRWWNGVFPISVTIITVIAALIQTGIDNMGGAANGPYSAADIFGSADAYSALLWGAFFGSVAVMILAASQYKMNGKIICACMKWTGNYEKDQDSEPVPLLTMKKSMDVWVEGVKGLISPTLILVGAWAIGSVIKDVGCDVLFSSILTNPNLDPGFLPVLTFLIASIISFCTGTSWGTMAMLFPMVTRPAWVASGGDREIFIATISAILAGSVFGDHSTAISDTTIMSALATKCDLKDHVRTQLPYAVVVAFFSMVFGYLPAGFFLPAWAGLLIGLALMVPFCYFVGKKVDDPDMTLDIFSRIGDSLGGMCGSKQKSVSPKEAAHLKEAAPL